MVDLPAVDRVSFERARAQLQQVVVELTMVSHAPTPKYDKAGGPDQGDDIGGRRPPGSNREHPRKRDVQEFQDFLACYQRRTPEYFRSQARRCRTVQQLEALVVEARGVVEAWRRMPIPQGQEPEYGTPQWKRFVAESSLSHAELARRFHVTPSYIAKVRRAMREGGVIPTEEQVRPK
jgi:hypothetical protein